MSKQAERVDRRRFLKAALQVGALAAAPKLVPATVLGRGGGVAPSERIVLGGIGIGTRGGTVLADLLNCPDAQFMAVCDVRAAQLETVKKKVDTFYGNQDCATYRDFRELLARPDIDAVLITTGSNWHALASILAAKAGKDVYCEKPCTKTIAESLALRDTFRRTGRVFQAGTQKRNTPHNVFAVELARSGALGKLHTVHAHPGSFEATGPSGWVSPHPDPSKDEFDWDMYVGPAAWRPYPGKYPGNRFEKGGGLVGDGVLEWGTHSVDLCQWANVADQTVPVEYEPPAGGRVQASYANGVKLVIRTDGWLTKGASPARFEGDAGWVETTNETPLVSSPELLKGVPDTSGHPALPHVRDFLDCVKSRGQPRANADAACNTHIACHAANIAILLGRKVAYDPERNEFIGDDQANRLRGEALRETWRF